MSDMPSGVAKSWLLYIAVGLSLVAAGAIVDSMLKKEEFRKLHARFRRWAKLLSETPIQRWQVLIADAEYKALHALHGRACQAIGDKWHDVFHTVGTVVPEGKSHGLGLYACFSLFWAIVPISYFVTGWWSVGSITFPYVVICLLAWCDILRMVFSRRGFTANFCIAMIAIPLISAHLSLCATLLTLYGIPEQLLNNQWYVPAPNGIRPAYPLLLPVVNLPFDFATIAVTMLLLGYVRRRRSGFLAVALIDTLLSLAFDVLLYAVLLTIEGGWDFLHFHQYLTAALVWFAEVGGCFGRFLVRSRPIVPADLRDIHLLPMLLTTFVPVALYMGIFIFLAFCKPVMRLAGRVFAVIGERDESVFKQFATLLAVILAAVKAIYDWLSVT